MAEKCCKCGYLLFETTFVEIEERTLLTPPKLPDEKQIESDKVVVCFGCEDNRSLLSDWRKVV